MKSKKQNLSDKILGHFDKKQRKINTLENENDTLKTAIKDELYILFMNKLREPTENVRLKK